jgi:protein SCO1/2
MNDRRKALAFLGLNAVGVLVSGAMPAFAHGGTPVLAKAADSARAGRMKRFFPNVALQTHDGRSVRFYDDLVKGKKVIINFTYTTCTGTCPRTSANLKRVQDLLGGRIGRDIFIISITVNPSHDTPEVLEAYAEKQGARPGWTFATGREADIDEIRRRLGLYDSKSFTDHTGLLTFGNEPAGKWGATPALDRPENIVYSVLRRVDPFKYTEWPLRTESRASDRSGQ